MALVFHLKVTVWSEWMVREFPHLFCPPVSRTSKTVWSGGGAGLKANVVLAICRLDSSNNSVRIAEVVTTLRLFFTVGIPPSDEDRARDAVNGAG